MSGAHDDDQAPAASVYGSEVDLDALPLSDAAAGHFAPPAAGRDGDAHPFALEELERYRRPQLLGVGGMGQVSAVDDFRLNRQVALKELPVDASDRKALEQRLAQEAWITAQLEHPGIVPVYDAGRNASGRLFFTMRLIRGRSLAQALHDADLELAALLRHFLAVCQAVGYAHARGVVHRDLKPANIMLGGFGETQVMDWGLARPVAAAEASPQQAAAPEFVPAEQAVQTAIGARVGTPAYMSPEQARAEPVGPASDVWSLGAVLFEVVTGAPLFEGKSSAEIYAVLERGAPPIHELPGVESELEAIVTCALSAAPDDRYADAKALADDVASYLDGRRVSAHTYSSWEVMKRFGRAFRLPLLAAAAALVTAAVVFGVSYSQTVDQRDRAQAAEGAAQRALERALAAESEEDRAQKEADRATREADTNYAARLILKASNAMLSHHQTEAEVMAAHALARSESLWARGLLARFASSARPELVARTSGDRRCGKRAISPDGQAYLCRGRDGLMLFSGVDGAQQWQTETEGGEFAFVTDAYILAVDEYGDTPAVLLDRDSGAALAELPIDQMTTAVVAGPRVLFGDRRKLRLWSSATDETVRLPGPAGTPRALSGDGRIALATDPKAGLSVIDTVALTTRALDGLQPPVWKRAIAALNGDGSQVALGGADGQLRLVSVKDGRLLWERTASSGALARVAWSPDDQWILTQDDKELPKVFHAGGGGRLGLPSLEVEPASWARTDRGVVLMTADAEHLMTYQVPDTFVATTFDVGQPIERLAVSGDGAVALAHGESSISHFRADGRLHRRHVLKGMGLGLGVAFAGSDDALAVTNGISTKLTVYAPDGSARDLGGESLSGWLFPAVDGGVVAVQRRESAALYPAKGDVQTLSIPTNMVTAAAGSADGRRFAALDLRGAVVWFEATASGLRGPHSFTPETSRTSLALDRTGRLLALGAGWEIMVLELDSGRQMKVFGGAPDVVSAVAFSPDGAWVAAGTYRGEVIVWSMASGRPAMIAELHREKVADIGFATGDVFYTASKDGTAARWGLSCLDKTPLQLLDQHTQRWGMELDEALGVQVR